MELFELRALVKVVQSGSFTHAADLLGTQKSHLSRVITGLERRLGVRLLERSTRSLRLTEVGREVFGRAIGILGAVDDTERFAQQLVAEPQGTLRITCGVEFGMLAVGVWIERYLARFPHMLVDADFTGRLVDVVHEDFDLAIRVGALADSNLAARRLGDIHYGLFASSDCLARHGKPMTPADLRGKPHLAFSGGRTAAEWTLSQGNTTERIEIVARLRVNNSFSLRDAVLAGHGIARLPQLVAAPDVAAGLLSQLLPDWNLPTFPVHAIYPSNRYLTPKVRAFVELAGAWFSEAATPETSVA